MRNYKNDDWILIKEAWIKRSRFRKKEITKVIERIVLEYDRDIYPISNFIFPHISIVGKVDKNNFTFLDDKISNTIRDYFAYDKRHFTISRNEIIILYHYYKDENIFYLLRILQKILIKKFNILIKFAIGSPSSNLWWTKTFI